MAKHRSSKKNAGGQDSSGSPIPPRSLERLDDAALAKLLLKSKRAERPWWSRLIDWLRQQCGV